MTKVKISATVAPERLARAREVSDASTLSELLDLALAALIERELERRWLDAHPDEDLPGEVPVDLSAVPWDDERTWRSAGVTSGGPRRLGRGSARQSSTTCLRSIARVSSGGSAD